MLTTCRISGLLTYKCVIWSEKHDSFCLPYCFLWYALCFKTHILYIQGRHGWLVLQNIRKAVTGTSSIQDITGSKDDGRFQSKSYSVAAIALWNSDTLLLLLLLLFWTQQHVCTAETSLGTPSKGLKASTAKWVMEFSSSFQQSELMCSWRKCRNINSIGLLALKYYTGSQLYHHNILEAQLQQPVGIFVCYFHFFPSVCAAHWHKMFNKYISIIITSWTWLGEDQSTSNPTLNNLVHY